MKTASALLLVVRAVVRISGSMGSPNDRPRVQAYLDANGSPQSPHFAYVGGIPLSHFFAFSEQAFENSEDSLWREIQNASAETANVAPPEDWDIDSTLLQIAVYIHIQTS